MGNLSKASFFDAGSNPPPTRAFTFDGPDGKERRLDKHPHGFVERWVDPNGNVVFEQIIPPGVPKSRDLYERNRARILRREEGSRSWIEHKTCPLSTGQLDQEDFPPSLQRACRKGSHGKGKACPHVEHTIKARQTAHSEARAARHAVANADRIRKETLERRQADQTQRLNDNIERLVGAVADGTPAKKGRKAAASSPATPEPATAVAAEPADIFEDDFDLEDDLSGAVVAESPAPKRAAKPKAKPRKR